VLIPGGQARWYARTVHSARFRCFLTSESSIWMQHRYKNFSLAAKSWQNLVIGSQVGLRGTAAITFVTEWAMEATTPTRRRWWR
jgi:hypothetical protein